MDAKVKTIAAEIVGRPATGAHSAAVLCAHGIARQIRAASVLRMASVRVKTAMAKAPRPETLEQVKGQLEVVDLATMLIAGAKKRGEALDHVLLTGPAGTGKTTMARVLAKEMGWNFLELPINSLDKPEEVQRELFRLAPDTILFIDEIHNLPRKSQEQFFHAMEDGTLNVTIQGQAIKHPLPAFTLIGATTNSEKLVRPFRDRFPNQFEMTLYSTESLVEVAEPMADSLGLAYDPAAIKLIAEMSGGTPRLVWRNLTRARDAMAMINEDRLTLRAVQEMMRRTGQDPLGLGKNARKMLQLLAQRGAMSLRSLSNNLGINPQMIQSDFEPLLRRYDLITTTAEGRSITEKGKQYLQDQGLL